MATSGTEKYQGPERRSLEPNGNGTMSKLVSVVAGALIVAALLGNYAYTRDGRSASHEEAARVEAIARTEIARVETRAIQRDREIKVDIRRELTEIKNILRRLEEKAGR